jgi:hypothetical protein
MMRFKKIFQLTITALIALSVFSCGKDSACFKGTGTIVKEQRTIPNEITSITTQDNIDIVITQSTTAALHLEGGANLLPYINTVISGGELSISSTNSCGMLRDYNIPITAYISLPNLTHINYTGQGVITNTGVLNFPFLAIESSGGTGKIHLNVNVDELSIKQHSGPADFTLTGIATTSYVYSLGNGWFDFKDLITRKSHVSHNGTGDIFVHANDELRVELRHSGNVLYTGAASLNLTEKSGSGEVIKK